MSQDTRRELISKNLGIKPINHGQVYTFQIAIPDSRKQTFSLEQRQAIEQSLLAHQSNLVSLIIRRTNAYADEDVEYELVYGADWLQIAQELDIERVWAWVFDLTNEQTIAAIAEMESLSPTSRDTQSTLTTVDVNSDIAAIIDKKLQLATDSIKNSVTSLLTGVRNDLDEKLKALNYKIERLDTINNGLDGVEAILEKLKNIEQKLPSFREIIDPVIENPINLLEAPTQDIEMALKQVKTQSKQISAAIKAVQYWKQSEQGLTWENLGKSKTNSQHKIEGFGDGTYNQLCKVATIPGEKNR